MSKKSILIVGCGDIGITVANLLDSDDVTLWGLRRDPSVLPAHIQGIAVDITDKSALKACRDTVFDTMIITLTPGEFSDARYREVYVEGLANILSVFKARYCIFVSSSSVYHQGDDQWVDEDSDTKPESFSGKRLLEAEALVRALPGLNTIVRFAGIYGPGRYRLIQQVKNREGGLAQYSNRIHRDDCAGFLAHLVKKQWQGDEVLPLYVGVDSEPVRMSELKAWLACELDIDPQSLGEPTATRRGSKRCSNRRMLASGYSLRYPGFREGYGAVLEGFKASQ